jgi:hypothetical protein
VKTGAKKMTAATAAKRIDQLIADVGDWRGVRLAEIRALIHEVDPDVVEDWKWMGTSRLVARRDVCPRQPAQEQGELQFFHGAQLRDPSKLFNAALDGGKWRAIDFFASDTIDKPALKALLREAVVYNTKHAVPKSKGSRAALLSDLPISL